MCGTPLEGGGAPSDITGSLDLSASLPGGADIDFSGLMDQVGEGGDSLFDGLDDGGAAPAGDGSLDLMLSDFEGNLTGLGENAGGASGEVPPPSGGEGWGTGAGGGTDFDATAAEDFSFSDLAALDPASMSEDISLSSFQNDAAQAGSAAEPPASPAALTGGNPLDFSFAEEGGGGLDFSDLAIGQGEAAGGSDLNMDGGAGGLDLGEDLFGGESAKPETALNFDAVPQDLMAEDLLSVSTKDSGSSFSDPSENVLSLGNPGDSSGGDDELEALLAEIDEADTGGAEEPATSSPPLDETLGGMDDLGDLFESAEIPSETIQEPGGLVFEEAPQESPAPQAASDDLDDLDSFFESSTDMNLADMGAPSPKPAKSDDLDDFLKELEGSSNDGVDDLGLDDLLGDGGTAAAVAAVEAAPVKEAAKPKASVDASDDEIAALIAGMETKEPEPEEEPLDLLDPGESSAPTGSSLDNFLDEITGGVDAPVASITGSSQPISGARGPTPLTSVPARLEEVDPKAILAQLEKAKDEDRRYQLVQRLAQLQREETAPEFIRLLHDNNLDIRECAVEALGNLGHKDSVRPLLKVLKTERGNIRYLAVEALGHLGDEAATDSLVSLLGEDDENMAYVVAEALGRIGDPVAVRPLINLSGTADKDLRYVIATSMGQIRSTEATPLLLGYLRDDDREVRAQAIRALGELADTDGAGALLDFLDEDGDPELVLEAVRALGNMKSLAAVRHLLAMLRTRREDLVVEIIKSLGMIGAPGCVEPIVARVDPSSSLAIQIAAVRALGELGDGAGVPALQELLASERTSLKVPIAEALAKIKVPEALPPLEQLLTDADVTVRQYAVEGIGALQSPSSVPHLERLVRDPDEGVRQACAYALGQIGVSECLPLLMILLRDSDPAVTTSAVEGLERIGTPAVETLVTTLEEEAENPEMLLKLVRVLGSIGDIRSINPLLEVFEDTTVQVRDRIAEALVAVDRKLVDGGKISTLIKEGYAWSRFRIAGALGNSGYESAAGMLLDIIEETYTDADEARLKDFPDASILLVNKEALAGVRAAAARQLGGLNLSDSVKAVLGRLVKAEGETRLWMVRTLGFIHKEASVSALIELIKKEEAGIPALFLGKVLKRIPLDITVERVLGAVSSASVAVRTRCAEVLGVLQNVKALGKLGELTRDPDEHVRLAAIGALERIGSNQAFDSLAKAVKDASATVRERAVRALRALPDDRAINVLGTALQDRVADVRGAAALALSSIKDKRVVPILLAGLKDESSEVRLSIVNTLSVLGDISAVKPLIQMLQDINSEVRQAAVRALGKIGDVESVGPLIRAMDDHDLWVKTEARKTLLSMGEESLPRKIEALSNDDESVQQNAVRILAEETSPKLYGLLLEAFSHRSKDMRANSAKVLGLLSESRAVVPLIHLLDDRDFEVREKAAMALGEIGDISASRALKLAQKDQNKDVRVAASHALKKIMELVDVG